MIDLEEIKAKSILSKSNIPGIDYAINPYIGCSFGCKYCYASFMGRFVDREIKDWGKYVFVKINAPELLKKEIVKLKDKGRGREIFLSSVTDPYQGVEAKYKITRQCLQIISEYGFEGVLSILTKSDLVLRDIDLFSKIRKSFVGLTVTSMDDGVSRYFETFAPPVSKRLNALKLLNKEDISTYAFVGPLLPHFVAREKQLEKLLVKIKDAGTTDIFIEHLNLSTYIKNRLMIEMKGQDWKILKQFYQSQTKEYRRDIEEMVKRLVKKHKMNLIHDMVIAHKSFQKKKNVKTIDTLVKKSN